MKVDVVMPQMGESVAESTITKWYKEVGDHVERDEELLELSADKVDADVPSPVSGTLVEIIHQAGETVEVNTVVAVIETEAVASGDAKPSDSSHEKETATESARGKESSQTDKPSSEKEKSTGQGTASVRQSDSSTPQDVQATRLDDTLDNSEEASAEELRQTRSTPLVRRIAAEHNIQSLAGIKGTGLSGRVTRDDILAYIDQRESEKRDSKQKDQSNQQVARDTEPKRVSQAPTAPQSTHRTDSQTTSTSRDIPQLPPIKVHANDRVEVLSPQRQAIARHMVASRATSPHAQTIHEVDFSAVVRSRKRRKAEFESRGVRLTFTSYLVQAVAQALVEFPAVNTSLDGTNLIYRGDINVGIAVDVGESLVVPVIKHADELSLIGISRAIEDLATRARNKKLTPEDMQAGTFTVSNHGIFGPEFGIPIINQPQTAIMSTGAIKKRVVVDQKTDAIMVRPTSIWCLSFDHRAIDGATADKFMARLREIIETWSD